MDTELGTLLLDSHLQGQLYVKQVWVSDQTKDGLAVGVNFKKYVSSNGMSLYSGYNLYIVVSELTETDEL